MRSISLSVASVGTKMAMSAVANRALCDRCASRLRSSSEGRLTQPLRFSLTVCGSAGGLVSHGSLERDGSPQRSVLFQGNGSLFMAKRFNLCGAAPRLWLVRFFRLPRNWRLRGSLLTVLSHQAAKKDPRQSGGWFTPLARFFLFYRLRVSSARCSTPEPVHPV